MVLLLSDGYFHGLHNGTEYPFFYDGYLKSQLYTKAEIDALLSIIKLQIAEMKNNSSSLQLIKTNDWIASGYHFGMRWDSSNSSNPTVPPQGPLIMTLKQGNKYYSLYFYFED